MRKHTTILIAIIGLFSLQGLAQENARTLFGSGSVESWGILLSPEIQLTGMNGEQTALGEVSLGAVINNRWYLAGYIGHSLQNIPAPIEIQPQIRELEFQSYGLRVEYTVAADNLFHLSFPLQLGVMEMEAEEEQFDNDNYDERSYFAITPGVNLELNLAKYVRLYTGARFRWLVSDIEANPVLPDLNSAVGFHAGLRIGLFEISRS